MKTNADYFCPKIDTTLDRRNALQSFVNNATGYHKFFEEPLSKETVGKEIQECYHLRKINQVSDFSI